MKKLISGLCICACLLVSFLQPVAAREAFVIEDVQIEMQIQEDGTYLVKENYTLDFAQARHGFYRTIPTKYEMQWTNEDTGAIDSEKYYFPVKNITCSTQCSVNYENDGVAIRLGDEDRTVIGKQTYEISYVVHTKDLRYHGAQMLYWDLIGNGFDTTIEHMSYRILMPKAFDAQEVFTNTGGYRENGNDLSYQIEGNIIYGELQSPLHNYESATIKVNLPNDYFQFPEPTDYLFYALLLTIALFVVSAILFYIFGKDDEVFVTVEFQAPQGLDSAGVGFVVDNMVDNKDIISLIIDWANRGYVEIEDENHHMTLKKVKSMEEADTTPYERIFFDAIFPGNTIEVSEADLKKAEVGKGLQQAKLSLSRYFTKHKHRRVYTSASVSLQMGMILMITIPAFACSFAALYMYYELAEMAIGAVFIAILVAVGCVPWIFLMHKRYVLKKSNYMALWAIMLVLNAIFFTITMVMMIAFGNDHAWIYAIVYGICELAMLFMLMFMDKRTKQGNRWLGQILGLKEFIETCEKERLELLVEENPSAFYDILPYAYVLGVSDVWSKKFEHILMQAPSWYHSSTYHGDMFTTYLWWSYFHRSFQNTTTAATYVASSNHGNGGGGFSSGGFSGGGFSGGGFGGGGGGSW